ncbi:IclR family transcriptional regulator [Rhizobium multihospitium]|uniref:Transcriptional regulator, IclR family n=1 Tax=Rhizobium multihospitium TaxID=410764 RepID=A0A1C3X3E0_9HYPH|nr:IclR family transcriptional regulator [Rhizobium multihospitium]SCB46773.1 transcriptional regulator, IclR family [Rhizobium multihospitium]
MAKGEGRGIQSIDIGGRLLSVLVDADGPMMLKDLAAIADLPPAQAHAYISSFRRLDLIEQDGATGRYQLGPLAIRLGLARVASFAPLRAARDATVKLELELGLMVALVVWGVGAPTALQVQTGNYPLNVNLRPGMALPILGSAAGRVFAAFGGPAGIDRIIDGEFSETTGDKKAVKAARKAFDDELETVRKTGYAVTRSEPVPDIDTIAAPVRLPNGEVIAVITVVGDSSNLDLNPAGVPILALLRISEQLSRGELK